jgi:hypothetical protein
MHGTPRQRPAFLPAPRTRACFCLGAILAISLSSHTAYAQSAATTRLLILQVKERQTLTAADLNVIRAGGRSGNADTVLVAIPRAHVLRSAA